MAIEKRIVAAADKLANIELVNFGRRLGLVSKAELEVCSDLLMEIVYAVDELSWTQDSESSRLAVQIIALTWEHSTDAQRTDLREFFIGALSRLGLSPSASMLDQSRLGTEKYSPFASYRGGLATLAMQLQYQERICGVEFFLTKFQQNVLHAAFDNRVLGISAPTSAGKSFALYLAIARYVSKGPQQPAVIYVVPTISLVNQVCGDLRELFAKLAITSRPVRSSFDSKVEAAVYVVTQERAMAAFDNGSERAAVGMLVVDEVQNLERVGDEGELRSKILFDVLSEFGAGGRIEQIILSGPRLQNVGEVGAMIFGGASCELSALETPVASITYSVSKENGKAWLTQHRDSTGSPASIEIPEAGVVQGDGQSIYTDSFFNYLWKLVSSLGPQSSNIIFSPTADQSRRTALSLFELSDTTMAREDRESLAAYLGEAVHPQYALATVVKRGIGFHTGKVPPHARLAIEQAFGDGLLKDIVCTTTLMQGVNLPANVVFIRNPKLYVKGSADRSNAELSPYEFANLRGRAGRLMRDLVGRTVILDEDSFRYDAGQRDLFQDAYKALSPGYAELFETNQNEVLEELRVPGLATSSGAKFVATHIRQTALRHGHGAFAKLLDVGVQISADQFARVLTSLQSLDVDAEICRRNRYWDPFDLQNIKNNSLSSGLAPLSDSPWDKGLAASLAGWLEFQTVVSPYYFSRYLGERNAKRIVSLAKSAESWAREVPLRSIIEDRHFEEPVMDKIDDQVSIIYKHVVYGVTAVLKPICDMHEGQGSALLAAIESGAHHPVTRFLISAGIYRETAVHVRRMLLMDVRAASDDIEAEVMSRLSAKLHTLDRWVRRQVEPLVFQ